MTKHTDADRLTALAGLFQAISLVRSLAWEGKAQPQELQISIQSIFELDPDSVPAVYGGLDNIKPGLRLLIEQMDQPKKRHIEMTRYAANLLQLAKKMAADNHLMHALAQDLEKINARTTAFNLEPSAISKQLAGVYKEHVSSLSPKIMVEGDPMHLQNDDNAARIRSALLAGIRSAHLWLQCGGSRRQLLFQRKKLVMLAKEML